MATFRGQDGVATFGGTAVANLKSWSISNSVSMMETTVKGDTHKKSRPGILSGTASIAARFDYVTGQKAIVDAITSTQAAAAFVLTTDTGKTYTTSAICTGHTVTSPEGDGTVEVSFDFELQTAVVIAWV